MIDLSICIPSLHSRTLQLSECLLALRPIKSIAHRVEILIEIDGGEIGPGAKRNKLIAASHGRYICHVDDDDLVSPGYLYKILTAIDEHEPDAVLIRGRRTEAGANPVEFDYRLDGIEGEWSTVDGGRTPLIWRSPGHICPIRAEIVKSVQFPDVRTDEDLVWSAQIASKLQSAARAGAAGEILYNYRWDSTKRLGT